MRTIYSLKEFRNEVLAIAALNNETYTSLSIEVGHDGRVTFKAYISKVSWHSGDTMEECLNNLRNAFTQPPINDIDVEIEMPEPVIEQEKVTTPTDDLPF